MNLRLALVALASVIVGCSPTTGPAPSAPSPTATAESPPTPIQSPAATAGESQTPSPSASATDVEPSPPPIGEMTLPDGTVVPGAQGSWCYDNTCLDGGPRPPANLPLIEPAQSGADLQFALAPTHPFTYWRVSYSVGNDDAELHHLASGGIEYDPDLSTHTPGPNLSSFSFSGLPSGDWRMEVFLQFADSRGSSVYYWHALVP